MTTDPSKNSLAAYDTLRVGEKSYGFFSLKAAEKTLGDLGHLPLSLRILLENMLRHEDGQRITAEDIRTLASYHGQQKVAQQVIFYPTHIVIGDEAGVSALTDVANLATAIEPFLDKPEALASNTPLDIIIAQEPAAIPENANRYKLMKWAERHFTNIRVVPPLEGQTSDSALTSICPVVRAIRGLSGEQDLVCPETVIGSQRNIPSLCHKGILAWQTNTLEVESLMLGHPLSFSLPPTIGVRITGKPRKGVGFNDIALTIMLLLRRHDAKGAIVEIAGESLERLTVGDRAALAQMAHYREGILAMMFPIDAATLQHLAQKGEDEHTLALTQAYAKAQGLWHEAGGGDHNVADYTTVVELNLDTVRPVVDYDHMVVQMTEVASVFVKNTPQGADFKSDPLAPLRNGDIVLASLGSIAAPPHPREMIIAGLVASEAVRRGLVLKPWVRALMPRLSPSLNNHLRATGLLEALSTLGFSQDNVITENPDAPPLDKQVVKAVKEKRLTLCALGTELPLPQEWQGYPFNTLLLTSPALVIAYAIAGSIATDISSAPVCVGPDGKIVELKDLLPGPEKIKEALTGEPCHILIDTHPKNIFMAPNEWRTVPVPETLGSLWKETHPTIARPPLVGNFTALEPQRQNIIGGRLWAIWGHEVQARWIAPNLFRPPAVAPTGNHTIMMEAAFQSSSLYNLMAEGEGNNGTTIHHPSGTPMTYQQATARYASEKVRTILLAGENLGCGWGQEWAAKALSYSGIAAVIAKSFDPSFRLNLIRVGVLPLQMKETMTLTDLDLTGSETISLYGIPELAEPPHEVMFTIERREEVERYMLKCRLDTQEEYAMYLDGSLWAHSARQYVI